MDKLALVICAQSPLTIQMQIKIETQMQPPRSVFTQDLGFHRVNARIRRRARARARESPANFRVADFRLVIRLLPGRTSREEDLRGPLTTRGRAIDRQENAPRRPAAATGTIANEAKPKSETIGSGTGSSCRAIRRACGRLEAAQP